MPIKVFLQTEKFKGGPSVFRSRLITALNKIDDIQIVTDINEKFHMELAFIRKVFKHNKPYILRVDGCYYDKKKLYNNKPISKAISGAEYCIFQSKFAYQLCNQTLRLEKRKLLKNGYKILYNGIDIDYINNIKTDSNIIPGSFMACARWRPNKRPVSTIKGFVKADTKRHLYMIGGAGLGGENLSKKYNSKYVHILGDVSTERAISIMKACDYQIHLCHIDACPNTVIEGLTCGLNILCSNLGGTNELVGNDGIILNIDKFWDTKYAKPDVLQRVDKVKSSAVADGIHKILKIINKSNRQEEFDINLVAVKYAHVIRKVFKRINK